MTEGEVIEQLIGFIDLLLVATGVFFTILSVYVAALHYALQNETWLTRTLMFIFVTLAFMMMSAVLLGARHQHNGLTSRLEELEAQGELSAAGRAALANARDGMIEVFGFASIDEVVVTLIWGALGLVYVILIYLTFIYRWRPEVSTAFRAPFGP